MSFARLFVLLFLFWNEAVWGVDCPNFDYHPSSVVVNTTAALRDAISASQANGSNDRIFLEAGKYLIDSPLVYLDQGYGEDLSLRACSSSAPELQAINTLIFRAYKGNTAEPCFGLCQDIYSPPFPKLEFVGLRFVDGTIDRDFDFDAGVIGATGFDIEVTSSQFENIFGNAVSYGRKTTVSSSTFSEVYGYAIYANLGSLSVSDSSFDAVEWGIYATTGYPDPEAPVLIKDSSFTNGLNRAVDVRIEGDGDAESQLRITGSVFRNNQATPVLSYVANNLIKDTTFAYNKNGYWGAAIPLDTPFCVEHDFAPCAGGGAISIGNYFHSNAVTVIEDSEFIGNEAPDYGGAIDFEGVRNCELTFSREGAPCDPSADGPEHNLIVRNSVFEGNKSHRGAAIAVGRRPQATFFQKGNVLIVDSVFDGNIAIANPNVEPSGEPIKAGTHGPIVENPPEDGMLTSVIDVGGRLEYSSLVLKSNTAEAVLHSRSQDVSEIFKPAPPLISTAEGDDQSIVLSFIVTNTGGKDVIEYEATCTDGTNSYKGTGNTSPIAVSGLINDVAYTCTVTATNLVGTSPASPATEPITPEEVSTGLPIWLLYKASQ